MTWNDGLAERIKEARNGKKMTQRELARKIGVTLQTIAAYERGALRPSQQTIARMVAVIGLSVDGIDISGIRPNKPLGPRARW